MTIKTAAAGAALALAAATLFAGVATNVVAADANVHCYGVTACKGQNDCKTKDHASKAWVPAKARASKQ